MGTTLAAAVSLGRHESVATMGSPAASGLAVKVAGTDYN
jgi:hypothetical protein